MKSIIISNSNELREYKMRIADGDEFKLLLLLTGELTGTLNLSYSLSNKSSLNLYLLTALSGKSDLAINYCAKHSGRESHSVFNICGTLDDKAKLNTDMKIFFENGSLNATGIEKEDIILLSDESHNVVSPIIISDEESASGNHSSSIGHIDYAQIEYLHRKGISQSEAKKILINAKFKSFLSMIDDENILKSIHRMMKI